MKTNQILKTVLIVSAVILGSQSAFAQSDLISATLAPSSGGIDSFFTTNDTDLIGALGDADNMRPDSLLCADASKVTHEINSGSDGVGQSNGVDLLLGVGR